MPAPSHLLAFVALLPAAANPSLIAQAEGITLALCGQNASSITIPGETPLPGTNGGACCAKGCHSSDKRKKQKGVIDKAQ